ncbi:MAG: hypothetical protein O7F76_04850 [Planctomycetota bacterium]|nr:hypothetical protein [Planctomycetota bacterium]
MIGARYPPMLLSAAGQPSFNVIDWAVIGGYLLLTTIIGAKLAGKQSTIRDFFLGGRKLPWWAICGSIIATEISAATFVIVPAIVFQEGGDFRYLQLGIGAVLARLVIGFWFVPKYYEHEIYSPYDYAERRLGSSVKKITTGLFLVGGILGQGARVYITALVLSTVADFDLVTSIWAIGLFSVGWTLLGGMTTVIWTDVIQFVVLMTGALFALGFAITAGSGGVGDTIYAAAAADKFRLWDLGTNPSLKYTLWCGLLATPFLSLAAFGTDQVMAQRVFCCRNKRDAQLAIFASSLSLVVTVIMLLLGAAMYVYFQHEPFSANEQALYDGKNDTVLPIFIVRALPTGVRGLIVAAIFASAVSTLDSTLAALSQSTLSAFIGPRVKSLVGKARFLAKFLSSEIGLSKALVVLWGAVLCLVATACIAIADLHDNAVDLAFVLVSYTYGPLLAILLLALLPVKRDGSGLVWAVPTTVVAIFGVSQHNLNVAWFGDSTIDLADWIVWGASATILALGLIRSPGDVRRVAVIVFGVLAVLFLHRFEIVHAAGEPEYLAFPWFFPIGTAMTFGMAFLLGKPTDGDREPKTATQGRGDRNISRKKKKKTKPKSRPKKR